MATALESSQPSRLLDERTTLAGGRREDGLHLALADDGTRPRPEAHVCEQLDHVSPPDRRSVDEVLTFAAAVESAGDRHLVEVDSRQRSAHVVEAQLDFAVGSSLARGAAREEHVVGLLRAQLARREAARRPEQRIGDVRLARSVRADNDGDARLEAHLDGLGERLEAANRDRAEVHGGPTLTAVADVSRCQSQDSPRDTLSDCPSTCPKGTRAPRLRLPAGPPSSSGRCRGRAARRRRAPRT